MNRFEVIEDDYLKKVRSLIEQIKDLNELKYCARQHTETLIHWVQQFYKDVALSNNQLFMKEILEPLDVFEYIIYQKEQELTEMKDKIKYEYIRSCD